MKCILKKISKNKFKDKFRDKFRDKYFFFLFCFFLSFVILFFCSKNSPFYPFNNWVDENAFYTVGISWRHGILPYLDLFEQKGPLLYLIFMLSSWILPYSFLPIFLLEVVCYTWFLYFSGKVITLFLEKKYVYFILPLFASLIAGSIFFSSGGSAEEFCLPILMKMLYDLLYYFTKGSIRRKTLFWDGFFAGVMAMIKFTFLGFPFAFMMCLFFCFLFSREYLKSLFSCVLFLLGMSIPVLGFCLYFYFHHGLDVFIHTYFIFNIFGYTKKLPLLIRIEMIFLSFYKKLTTNVIVFHLIDLGMIYFLVRGKLSRKGKVSFILFFSLGALGIYYGAKAFYYYFLMILPFCLIGFISLFLLLKEKVNFKEKKIRIYTFLVVIFGSLIFVFTSPNLMYAKNKKEDLVQYQFAKIIQEGGGKTLLNYGFLDGGFYFASRILPNTKYFEKQNAFIPGMREKLDEEIREQKFDYIVLRRGIHMKEINPNILNYYELVSSKKVQEREFFYTYLLYHKKNYSEKIIERKE